MTLPIVAITMGDAAGIGPEIVVKALGRDGVSDFCRPLVVGDARRLRRAAALSRVDVDVRPIAAPAAAAFASGAIDCIDLALVPEDLEFGELSAVAGDAAFRFIERAVALALASEVDAICTAPVNKAALHAGGHRYPGHTEILAHLTGTPEVSMMLCTPVLRVIHCTTHVGLIDAIARIDAALVERTIQRGHDVLVRLGHGRAAHRRLRHQPARGGGRAVRRRRGSAEDRARCRARPVVAASTLRDRFRPTRFSIEPCAATSIWWWRCTTTRDIAR